MVETPAEAPERFATVAEGDEALRTRARTRWFLGGCGVGIAQWLVGTAMQVADGGHTLDDVPGLFIWNSAWVPYPAVIAGLVGLVTTRRPGPRMWRRPRFRTRSLMLIVACSAFLFGPVASSCRMSGVSSGYSLKAINFANYAAVCREQGRKIEADAESLRRNVAGLRAGEIPVGLRPSQREFLRSLEEPGVDPDHRRHRRDLITDGEDRRRIGLEQGASYLRRLVEYYEGLKDKYDRARWRPWLPVEPDPPMPLK